MTRILRSILTLCYCLAPACSDGSHEDSSSWLQVDTITYSTPRVDARALVSPDGHELRLLVSVDPDEQLADDEVVIRVDARIGLALPGTNLSFFGTSRLSVEKPHNTRNLEVPLDCSAADAEQRQQSFVEQVCVNVSASEPAGVITERVGGTITLDAVDKAHMRGRVRLWAVGLDAEEIAPENLAFFPLFTPGVAIAVPFDAEIAGAPYHR